MHIIILILVMISIFYFSFYDYKKIQKYIINQIKNDNKLIIKNKMTTYNDNKSSNSNCKTILKKIQKNDKKKIKFNNN